MSWFVFILMVYDHLGEQVSGMRVVNQRCRQLHITPDFSFVSESEEVIAEINEQLRALLYILVQMVSHSVNQFRESQNYRFVHQLEAVKVKFAHIITALSCNDDINDLILLTIFINSELNMTREMLAEYIENCHDSKRMRGVGEIGQG